jgi:exo-beta-1,3-glucanase (GH17 family)
MLDLEFEHAICYSGYRRGQNPGAGLFPSYDEVKEDMLILQERWKLIRLYDSGEHADMVLDVIAKEGLGLRVLLGAHIAAEVSNPACPWGGGTYTDSELQKNRALNEAEIKRLIVLAGRYPSIVCALSVGNEATVDWTDHLVPVERVIGYVRTVKAEASQPVTFCENYVPWQNKLADLAEEVDFISIHTYPVWEYQGIDTALEFTKQNYFSVARKYPHKRVVITEAGWTTNSNGRGIPPHNVDEDIQDAYHQALVGWCQEEGVLTFLFEAFDEDWKGSEDPMEPEKHWGLFTIDRKPKKVMLPYFAGLA